ncbi:MAG: hypothetical protein ACSHX0_02590 [Akkermansiaceae bacterium]
MIKSSVLLLISMLFIIDACYGENMNQKPLNLARGEGVIKVSLQKQRQLVAFEKKVISKLFSKKAEVENLDACIDERHFFRMSRSSSWGVKIIIIGEFHLLEQKRILDDLKCLLEITDFKKCNLLFYKEEIRLANNFGFEYKQVKILGEYAWVNKQ